MLVERALLVHQHALGQKPQEEIADPTRVALRPLVHGLQAGQLAEDKAGQEAGEARLQQLMLGESKAWLVRLSVWAQLGTGLGLAAGHGHGHGQPHLGWMVHCKGLLGRDRVKVLGRSFEQPAKYLQPSHFCDT